MEVKNSDLVNMNEEVGRYRNFFFEIGPQLNL